MKHPLEHLFLDSSQVSTQHQGPSSVFPFPFQFLLLAVDGFCSRSSFVNESKFMRLRYDLIFLCTRVGFLLVGC
jgi:hypothetical protein